MARNIRVRGVRRKEIDEDKLAMALLMLAKILHERDQADGPVEDASTDPRRLRERDGPEAA
jgi:hypothetical protein